MKTNELKAKSKEELAAALAANVEKLQRMRFDMAFNKVKDIKEAGRIKKDVARIKTLLRG